METESPKSMATRTFWIPFGLIGKVYVCAAFNGECGIDVLPFKMSLPVTTLTPMGYFSNLKAKRADKAATKEYSLLDAIS
jgi:hypothetical protein